MIKISRHVIFSVRGSKPQPVKNVRVSAPRLDRLRKPNATAKKTAPRGGKPKATANNKSKKKPQEKKPRKHVVTETGGDMTDSQVESGE